MKLLKTLGILVIIVAVFGGAMFGLHFYTEPLIEAHNAGAANERLTAVMPDGKDFEDITATLTGLPETVTEIYKETSGLGYVIVCNGITTYSKTPMVIIVGVSADGKICGINIDSYGDASSDNWNTKLDAAGYPDTYIGKDSALADVGLSTGATFSEGAFKTAVTEAMSVLTANNMITAGKKSDAQILEELIPTVAPGFTKLKEAAASGNVEKAFGTENGTGFAYVVKSGEASVLAIVNAMGVCKVYDVEGADVTADNAAVVAEATALASASQDSYIAAFTKKVTSMMPGAADVAAIELDTFNTVVAAVSFNVEGVTYYAFYSRSIGFHQMDVYFVIDENGAIAKMDAKQFIFDEEYFMSFGGMDPIAYKNGFVGLNGETFTGEQAVIATATMTSNAIKESTKDAFDAFNSIKGGEQ